MKKSNLTKVVVTLLAMILVTGALFAMGMKESDPSAVAVRVLATSQESGRTIFLARNADGQDITFAATAITDSSFPVSSITEGDYLEVVLVNNTATSIRYITPLVNTGAYGYDIPMGSKTPLESLTDRFSYTYGFLLMDSFSAQGLYFDAGYYAKGALDGYRDALAESFNGYYTLEELYANVGEYQENIWNTGLAVSEFGKAYSDVEEVKDLPKSEDLTKVFSYTYGYLLSLNMANQGFKINGDIYAQGALDFASGNTPLMNELEMQIAFTEYQQLVEQEYMDWISEIADSNLAEADAYLEFNKSNDGVITTASGLQYQVLTATSGEKPTMEDIVEVNYQLQLMDGTVLESSYDYGQTAHFPVNGVIPGFAEALLTMNTGSVIRTWIHPSLGYGEMGTETILPNTLLIFDIELVGIDR